VITGLFAFIEESNRLKYKQSWLIMEGLDMAGLQESEKKLIIFFLCEKN